ncbi:MAG TPA: ArsA-related P-loop ATPase [Acidimicrobiales bacterium]|nr:ArsA-related P-loop ATPase [Acidimicrobiales bacterium]
MTPAELARTRSVLICCGSGGVGKTTVAAAFALEAARMGRRACVVTIDPAKRLADALGLGSLSNTPTQVELAVPVPTGSGPDDATSAPAGPGGAGGAANEHRQGELWALMLDTKTTFDELVRRYAASDQQAEGILDNRLYRNLSQALSGTQEYMAMEKLYELHTDTRFDLVVVDTPPTRNALDFLDAPRRLTRFLDNRIFRLLIMPTRAYLKAVSLATQAFLRTVSKVVGAEVVDDAVAFFQAFEGMEAGFRDRAARVETLLSDPGTAFVVVASARKDTVIEAAYFIDRLSTSGFETANLVVNRLHPRFGEPGTAARLRAEGRDDDLVTNLAQLEAVGEREEGHFAELAAAVAPAPVTRIPFLADDVHDLGGLEKVATYLFAD